MAAVKKIHLTPRKRAQLEEGYREGFSESYRTHCQMVLLKADGLTDKEIAKEVGCHPVTVSNWIKRYQAYGIKGFDEKVWMFVGPEEDQQRKKLNKAINAHKKELAKAKAEWHKEMEETGTQGEAFNRFLELLVKDINV